MNKIIIDFDALKQDHWSDKELENATVIKDFVQHLMNNHDFDYVLKTHGKDPYVQHNRAIPDGIDGLVEYVRGFADRFPDYTYDVKRIMADGDYVVFHSHATTRGKMEIANQLSGIGKCFVYPIQYFATQFVLCV